MRLARRSRIRFIREMVPPGEGSTARVGPGYVGALIEFVEGSRAPWRPALAAESSASLGRCLRALESLARRIREGC